MYKRSALAAVLLCGAICGAPAVAGELRVGAGRVSVTPAPSDFPFAPSTTPSLNTGPGERSFVGVHDEVYARAMVIDDGERRAVLVVLEATAVPAAADIMQGVAEATGVPMDAVMVAATHTHSVPLFSYAGAQPSAREQREIERLKQGAIQAAKAAVDHLRSARVAFGRGQGFVNINNGEQAGLKTGYDPLGPSDKSLDVVRFDTPDGAPIAILVNYASHAEVMFRSVTKDGGYEVSGDLPGAVSQRLETQLPAKPVVLFTAGAEADQLTLFKSLQNAGPLPPTDAGAGGWALLDAQARRLAGSVLDVMVSTPPGVSTARLGFASGAATCPGQQLKIDRATGAVSVEARPPVSIPLSAITLGDIALAGVGGDVATAIGQGFKAASPARNSTMITLAGASVGYVFADASYAHPGHGLTKSLLAPHCAEPAVVEGLVGLIGEASRRGR